MPKRTAGPTLEQLLILVARAERGRLSAAEAARFRVGLRLLAEADVRQRHSIAVLRGRVRLLERGVDEEARAAVERVRYLGRRWLRVRDRQEAGAAVLEAVAPFDAVHLDRGGPEKGSVRPSAARTTLARPVPASTF